MFGSLGMPELILILVVVLVIFGAGKLPEVGASLGKGIRDFKKSMSEADEPKPQIPEKVAEPLVVPDPAEVAQAVVKEGEKKA
jgi:sec-independent protein translocase protein TatA